MVVLYFVGKYANASVPVSLIDEIIDYPVTIVQPE